MATASIRINGSPTPVTNISISGLVSLTNFDNTGVTAWQWVLVDRPAGSTATLSTPTSSTSSFTADIEGSYLIRLIVNSGEDEDTAVAAILTTLLGVRLPAANEKVESDSAQGWASALNSSISTLEEELRLGQLLTAASSGVMSAGVPVRITSNYTLSNGDVVPVVSVANASVSSTVPAVGVLVSAATGANQKVAIRVYGHLKELVVNTTGASAGDPVYVSDSGTISITPGSVSYVIGYVETVGASGTVFVKPSLLTSGSAGLPVAVDAGAGSGGVATTVSRSDHKHQVTTAVPVVVTPDASISAGVSTSLSRADHQHGVVTYSSTPATVWAGSASAGTSGADPARGDHQHSISTGDAPVGILPDASVSIGTSNDLVRADHQHGIQTYNLTPTTITDSSSSAGTSGTKPSRGDHTHGHGNRGGGTLHAQATTSVDGFMSASDKEALNWHAASQQNLVINGSMDIYQRVPNGSTIALVGPSARTFYADRWASWINGGTAELYRTSTPSGYPTQYAVRLQRDLIDTDTSDRVIAQELDRDFVRLLRGNKATLSFMARAGANYSAASSYLVVRVATGTGAESEIAFTTGLYTTGHTTDVESNVPISTSYAYYSVNVPTLGSSISTLEVRFKHVPVGTAGADDWFEISQVSLVVGTSPIPATTYSYAGASMAGETLLCQRYYEKSYTYSALLGATTPVSASVGIHTGQIVAHTNNITPVKVRFMTQKRTPPTISLWSDAGVASNWSFDDGTLTFTCTATDIGTNSFHIANFSGVGQTLTSALSWSGHWAADAEI